MGQSELRNIFIKMLLGVIAAVLFAFFMHPINKSNVKRNRPNATEKKLDFLVNRRIFRSKYHLLVIIFSALCVIFIMLQLLFMIQKENLLDMKIAPDGVLAILILLTLGASGVFSFLDNQITVKRNGIWCKTGLVEKIVQKREIKAVTLTDDSVLLIQLKNETEIRIVGLKDPLEARNYTQSFMKPVE